MNSYNHYAYGAVCQWLFEGVAGFRPDPEAPGFRRILFQPTILPRLGFAKAHHDSPAGRIEAEWSLGENGIVDYRVLVPEGTEGVLILGSGNRDVTVDGTAMTAASDGTIRRSLGSGENRIAFRLP